jgi:putative tryptophan/tyrosine transport system substrate-binding protein
LQAAAGLLPLPMWPALAASPTGRVMRVGILGATTAAGFGSQWEAFQLGLRDLGWVEGRDLVYELRFADNQPERLPPLAADLVALRVDLLTTHGIPGTRAAKGATATIPILMASVADPVAAGLVSSFARPGGNVTGIAFLAQELAAKRLQLLKEALPGLQRAAVLSNSRNAAYSDAMFEAMQAVAAALQLQLQRFDAPDPLQYDAVFAQIAARRQEAVAITEEATFIAQAGRLAALAQQQRLPSVGNKEFAQAGGLIGYGANREAIFRRAAVLADKLLRGAKPADVPVEQPTAFELVLNARAAQGIGLALPPRLRLQADEVIE